MRVAMELPAVSQAPTNKKFICVAPDYYTNDAFFNNKMILHFLEENVALGAAYISSFSVIISKI